MILEREGKGLFGGEEIRFLCKILRFAYDPELDERLRARIERMDGGEAGRVVRAFSVCFQLVNVAERYHRVRRRQYEAEENNEPQRASLRSTLGRLARDGAGAGDLGRILEGMDISLVLTAQPTEAQRRTIRRRHGTIACILDVLDSGRFTARERKGTWERLAEEITLLWQTDELRAERPEVEGEIQRALLFFKASLIPATLEVYRDLEGELARSYGDEHQRVGPVLEFGSWVGGDQDGNPFVRPKTMLTALGLQRELVLERHRGTALSFARHLTQSVRRVGVSEELEASLRSDEKIFLEASGFAKEDANEPYRRKMLFVAGRLRRALESPDGSDPKAYPDRQSFRRPPGSTEEPPAPYRGARGRGKAQRLYTAGRGLRLPPGEARRTAGGLARPGRHRRGPLADGRGLRGARRGREGGHAPAAPRRIRTERPAGGELVEVCGRAGDFREHPWGSGAFLGAGGRDVYPEHGPRGERRTGGRVPGAQERAGRGRRGRAVHGCASA